MLRILLDPAQPAPGEYDYSFLLTTLIEQAVFQQLGRRSATINSFRRGLHAYPTEREREQIIKGWMPDVVIPIRQASETELAKITKTAGCCVEYLPVDLPENRFNRQEMENALAPYYALADKVIAGLKKSFSDKLPTVEIPVVEETTPAEPAPVEEEAAPDVTEEVTEPAG